MVKIAFLHPDLGIGGAERLVVDAALALKSKKHDVRLFTAHHDPKHCFSETRDGQLDVTCVGDWLPRRIADRCYALCAFIRMMFVALYAISAGRFDVFVCDQVSACIPLLRLFSPSSKVLFYCHFPDKLLAKRDTSLKAAYRLPLDWVEEKTTGMAHAILVNSSFTADTYLRSFPSLKKRPEILYPSLNFSAFDAKPAPPSANLLPPSAHVVFLSINRYERKKNLVLALEAMARLRSQVSTSDWKGVHLVMAGGYDERVTENVEHYAELRESATRNDLDDHVTFVRSFTDDEKLTLLSRCVALIYTPSNEHFGICPVEAMYMSRPVIAVNSGGPLESIEHGSTGFLCEPTADEFAAAMKKFVVDPGLTDRLGPAGKERVVRKFSFKAFTEQLNGVVCRL
ncbi:alpha-1,3/1,6-mannosyltransferase ALG2-like [Oscarella lobularis]|uniref:alpha-1,3/1,6-mannosyltransferase ALG2-like n=1 Tax=Oscarella lobularis TaxID=121494 RepID=UPI0033136A96